MMITLLNAPIRCALKVVVNVMIVQPVIVVVKIVIPINSVYIFNILYKL